MNDVRPDVGESGGERWAQLRGWRLTRQRPSGLVAVSRQPVRGGVTFAASARDVPRETLWALYAAAGLLPTP